MFFIKVLQLGGSKVMAELIQQLCQVWCEEILPHPKCYFSAKKGPGCNKCATLLSVIEKVIS